MSNLEIGGRQLLQLLRLRQTQLIGVHEYLTLGNRGRYVDTSQPKQQRLERSTGLPMLQYESTLSFISGYAESEVAVFLHSNGIHQSQVQEEIEPISNDYFSPAYVDDRLGRKFLRLRLAYLAGLIDA